MSENECKDTCEGGATVRCPVDAQCGGCKNLRVPYAAQLADKQQRMAALFADVAPRDAEVRPILGMECPYHYRNKVISPYAPGRKLGGAGRDARGKGDAKGRARDGRNQRGKGVRRPQRREILTGMYAAGTHRLIPTDECAIENRTAKAVTLAVRDIMARYGVAPYDEDAGTGFMRHTVVRVGHESGEVLVTLVTNGDEFPNAKSFCRELVRRVPAVTTVVQNVNTRRTNVILGTEERTLYGPGFILDTLCGLSFRISSRSFYQVNAVQTEVLYREAIRLAGLTGTETVIDAYCGTGTIGLVAACGVDGASGAARVIGVDNVADAIRDARSNARHNGVENAEFFAEDATDFMRKLAASGLPAGEGGAGRSEKAAGGEAQGASADGGSASCGTERRADEQCGLAEARGSVDVLLMDPPRAGSTSEFLRAAVSLEPRRIVYISCNPDTQARDAAELRRLGYVIRVMQPVDMFPHTDHVENICLFERRVHG